ncbi:hypothetical protein [Micromonospora aurantiaca (nom. illeg.)]|uniref:hypothetical protein n=1 Tax=Micromonospora aurantiaca (nom. illeg.) TaxID=47850 RepID=UPI0001BF3935|nr:hypothetical protein [Micromonospora aurantiaca]ADL43690.1 hypothetical protein Micau_0121 [Micromonospora aurantiaca ATCC 27029]
MTPDASPTVDRLAGLFDWDGATETEIDWTALTEAAGHPFPEDYRRFVERLPHGSIGFLEVLHPSDWGVPEFLRYARNWHHVMNKRAECTGGFPYHFGTSPGDLRVWGAVNFDYLLCWHLDDGPPEQWPTVVCDTALIDPPEPYAGTATALLVEIAELRNPVPVIGYVTEIDGVPFRLVRHE